MTPGAKAALTALEHHIIEEIGRIDPKKIDVQDIVRLETFGNVLNWIEENRR
jgi:hypothetical protein